jgi:hypothetical protein
MLDWLDLALGAIAEIRSLVRNNGDEVTLQTRRNLRRALSDLKFSQDTIHNWFDASNSVEDYAAIGLRDSERRIGEALKLLSTFVNEQHASLRLRELANQVRVGKLSIRRDIQRALLREPVEGIMEKIQAFNANIDELDHQLLGPTL